MNNLGIMIFGKIERGSAGKRGNRKLKEYTLQSINWKNYFANCSTFVRARPLSPH
jgi:hypothetical protein